ncbi:uncharacterized protein EI97DRAFT_461197 [Westerdykella ornata]|uniref:Uncharacterized protein n=1 Tax=Westerdykella ornata TaxID=318751 RepID=A0A6A6JAG8_WESOR|nr:uncharacterized protein EI97DRAFT_461197 [Westerdykella ornata]KAF2273315.1 hypothetical protein EI97DRAFT_461197 [Westerdykella ornata]
MAAQLLEPSETTRPASRFSTVDAYGNRVHHARYTLYQMPRPLHRSADPDSIDPVDGKTKQCNRSLTFDSFLDERHLGEDKAEKRIGHTWELWRGVSKALKKATSRSRRRKKRGNYTNMEDGERILKSNVAGSKAFG